MTSRHDREAVAAAVLNLQSLRATNGGRYSTVQVRAVADRFEVTERTVWSWLRDVPKPRPAKTLGREVLVEIAMRHGNRRAAYDALVARRVYDRSYSQFCRDVDGLDPATRAGVLGGVPASFSECLYLRREVASRLDLVLFDHTEADIQLRRPTLDGGWERFKPWISVLIDHRTRLILSGAIIEGYGQKGDPNTEVLVALVTSAIRGYTTDGVFVGGCPRVVQCDGAKAHMADAMLAGYTELGIASVIIPPGSPWCDGVVEAAIGTSKDEMVSQLPGYTHAIKDRYSHEPWPIESLLTIDAFHRAFNDWVNYYNHRRLHSALGCTPFEAWAADPSPVERVDDTVLARGFLKGGTRAVTKNGVHLQNIWYTHPSLRTLVGSRVDVGYLPHDPTSITIHHNQKFICVATPHGRLTAEQRQTIIRERSNEIQRIDRLVKIGRQRRTEAHARHLMPDVDHGPPLDTTEAEQAALRTEIERAAGEGDLDAWLSETYAGEQS